MIWGRRQFSYAEYTPYFDLMEKLLLANPTLYREFIMVGTERKAGVHDVYVGVPNKMFMAAFDGFEPIEESALPKIIDTLHIADASTDEFKSRFEFKHNQRPRSQ
jgi:hypothetical protein